MNTYEEMITEFEEELIIDDTTDIPPDIKGFYTAKGKSSIILLSKNLQTVNEKVCILAEEIGHHYTTVGDITDMSKVENRRQEEKARRWAAKRVASLKDFINAFEAGCRTREEFAEYISITEEFLDWALNYYHKKYGLMTTVDKRYIVYFQPFGIMKML